MAETKSIRVRLKGYDHKTLDEAVKKIVEAAKKTGAQVVGPIPLPTERKSSLFCVPRSRIRIPVNNSKSGRTNV